MKREGMIEDERGGKRSAGDRLFSGLFAAFVLCSFVLVYFGSAVYKANYYPEMSQFEFLPYRIIIVFLACMPLMVVIGFFLVFVRSVFSIFMKRKKRRPERSEWVTVILSPVTCLAVTTVYKIVKIYTYGHPEIDFKEWVVIEFFACNYVAAFVSGGGALLAVLVGRHFGRSGF